MKTLENNIAAYDAEKAKRLSPEILETMAGATRELRATALEAGALKTGDRAAAFELTNYDGGLRSLEAYLAQGPLILSFYRGGWCPYCNLELNALQAMQSEFQKFGARLVAVSPETPDHGVVTRENNNLTFDVLYDQGNEVARAYGLVFTLPEVLVPFYAKFDLMSRNGDDRLELPMPATYIIRPDGEIAFHFVNADYTRRQEPAELVEQLARLAGTA